MNRRLLTAGLLTLAAVLITGCGGISANGSASPATFLIPGIGKIEPKVSSPATPPIQIAAN